MVTEPFPLVLLPEGETQLVAACKKETIEKQASHSPVKHLVQPQFLGIICLGNPIQNID